MASMSKFHGKVDRGSEGSQQSQHASASESKVESPGEAERQRIMAEQKIMPKLNTKGASIGSENGAEFRPAYKGPSKAVGLTPVNGRPSGRSVQHKNIVYARKRGKRSTRTGENNSTGVPMADTAAAKALVQTCVPATDVADPRQGKASNADQFDPTILLGQNLDIWAQNFDLSSAESSLASLYGDSERDSSIEFAVKLLMGETPLPKEAAEVEEFFRQKMNSEKSRKPGPSRSQ